MDDLARLRGWYAEDLRLRTPVRRNPAVVEAFAAVPRERFLGPGPWRILSDNRLDQPFETPDAAPHWLYHDVLVTIDPARRLNNGLPSFWAHNFDYLDLRRGERVLQVGAGTGYYSALLAEMVGPHGRVTAVEYDAALAAQARANLAPWRHVEVVAGDGRAHDPGEVDAVVAFAGSTHPAPLWLERLSEGGRLLIPLTGENWWGFMLRGESDFDAETSLSRANTATIALAAINAMTVPSGQQANKTAAINAVTAAKNRAQNTQADAAASIANMVTAINSLLAINPDPQEVLYKTGNLLLFYQALWTAKAPP